MRIFWIHWTRAFIVMDFRLTLNSIDSVVTLHILHGKGNWITKHFDDWVIFHRLMESHKCWSNSISMQLNRFFWGYHQCQKKFSLLRIVIPVRPSTGIEVISNFFNSMQFDSADGKKAVQMCQTSKSRAIAIIAQTWG